MARVIALCADLLFGSRVQGQLSQGGHEVELASDPARLRARLADGYAAGVLVVDLTDPQLDGAAALVALREGGALDAMRTLAFYSHVDVDARAAAEAAGFDLIVPRSRMAREGAALIDALTAPDRPPAG